MLKNMKRYNSHTFTGIIAPVIWYVLILGLSLTEVTDDLGGAEIILFTGAVVLFLSIAFIVSGLNDFKKVLIEAENIRVIDSVLPLFGTGVLVFYGFIVFKLATT